MSDPIQISDSERGGKMERDNAELRDSADGLGEFVERREMSVVDFQLALPKIQDAEPAA